MEEAMHVWEQEVFGKSRYLPLNLAVSLKLLLKCFAKKDEKNSHKILEQYMNESFLLQGDCGRKENDGSNKMALV